MRAMYALAQPCAPERGIRRASVESLAWEHCWVALQTAQSGDYTDAFWGRLARCPPTRVAVKVPYNLQTNSANNTMSTYSGNIAAAPRKGGSSRINVWGF